MSSFLFSSLLLLLAQNVFAAPAPQQAQAAAPVITPGPALDPAAYQAALAKAQASLASEFSQEVADFKAYADIPVQTSFSLSPQEAAAEASLLHYYSTASFSDVPYATSIPASVLAELYGGATGTGAVLPAATDPCGPKQQDGTEWDTCTIHKDGTPNRDGSPFVWYTDEPAYYGVQCLPVPAAGSNGFNNAPAHTVPKLNTANCNYSATCDRIQSQDWARDTWHWDTDGGEGCAVGIWLPSGDGVAEVPDTVRCRDAIYGTMGLYCNEGGAGGDGGIQSQVAAVNLVKLPGGGIQGQQVNAGYPSYLIAPEVLVM
ncbi:MAG: hypothetical protein Q9170_001306 [Blastenia crenularia]